MNRSELQKIINSLDVSKIHLVYFVNRLKLSDISYGKLKIVLKLFNLFSGQKIDHTAHISRFFIDEEGNKVAKIFEATVEHGMIQRDLLDKAETFNGSIFIESIDKEVDKSKAKIFENKYYQLPYSKIGAVLAGLDGAMNVIRPGKNSLFCSYLQGLFLKDQNIEVGEPEELTPSNIFNLNLGTKILLKL